VLTLGVPLLSVSLYQQACLHQERDETSRAALRLPLVSCRPPSPSFAPKPLPRSAGSATCSSSRRAELISGAVSLHAQLLENCERLVSHRRKHAEHTTDFQYVVFYMTRISVLQTNINGNSDICTLHNAAA
jgi:hypothetical protein